MNAVSKIAYAPQTSADWDDRFSQAVIISAIVHVALIFGLQFQAANPNLFDQKLPIEVVLVNMQTQDKPLKPEVLAQVNLEGGGSVEAERQRTSPLPLAEHWSIESAPAQRPETRQAEIQPKPVQQQARSSYSLPTPQPESSPEPSVAEPAPLDLAQRALEMARLAARIDKSWEEYQKRPRRLHEAPPALAYPFARYIEDWRLKVERYGNTNYPEVARRNQLYGSLVLTVEIKSDGSVLSAEVDRSSGSKLLDAAALKIVENAGPYAPFPLELRKHADIIPITRTFTFTREDQLTSR